MNGKKRFIVLLLTLAMVLSQMSVAAFAVDSVADDQDQTVTEQAVEETQPAAEENSDTVAAEPEKTAPEEVAFNQSETVDGVKVTVKADKGVFPAGSTLRVKKVAVPSSVDDGDAAVSYAFDITIIDKDGNEIQPDGKAEVSFKTDEVANDDLDVAVYHMNGKKAEELDVQASGKTAVVEAEGFSTYVLVFTKIDETATNPQYTMGEGQTVALKTIIGSFAPVDTSTYDYAYSYWDAKSSDASKLTISTAQNGDVVASVVATATIANGESLYIDVPYEYWQNGSHQILKDAVKITVKVTDLDSAGEMTEPTAVEGLVYNGEAQALIVAGNTKAGTMFYNVDGGAWTNAATDEALKRTAAGTYTVNWKIDGSDGNVITSGSVEATIDPAKVTEAPKAATLVYNGADQALLETAGTTNVKDGKFEYCLADSATTKPTTGWTSDISSMKGKPTGTYHVWYRVVNSAGTKELTDSYCLDVTIAPAEAGEVTAPEVATGLVYNEAEQELIKKPGSAEKGTMKYFATKNFNAPASDVAWETDYTKVTWENAGEYVVWYKVTMGTGAAEKDLVVPTPLTVKIDQAEIPLKVVPETGLTYNDGKDLATVTTEGKVFTVKYLVDDKDANDIKNNGYSAGKHTLTCIASDAAGNYKTATAEKKIEIGKQKVVVTEPTAKTLPYNGQVQELITAGETPDGFAYQYRLEEGAWTDNAVDIKGKDVNIYTVKYKVVAMTTADNQDLDDDNYVFVDEDGTEVSRIGYCYPEIELVVDDLKVYAKDMTYGDNGTTKYVESEKLGGILDEEEWDITYYYAKKNATKWETWGPDSTTPVGDYDIKVVVKDPNELVKFKDNTARGTFKVETKTVTVRALDFWLAYGDTVDPTTDFDSEVTGLTPEDEKNIDNILKISFTVKKDGEDAGSQPYAKGTYAIVPEATKVSDAFDNYTFNYSNGNLYVTEASENKIELEVKDYVYGDTIVKPTATAEYGTPTIQWIAEEDYSNSRADNWTDWSARPGYRPVNAGAYIVRATVNGTDSYPGGEVMKTFIINKKEATIKFSNGTSVYDGNAVDPSTAAKATVTGTVNNETLAYTPYSDPTPIKEAGSYKISATVNSTADVNKNYIITVEDGIYNVTEAGTMTARVEYVNTDSITSGHCVFNGERHGIKVTAIADEKELTSPDAKVYYSLEELDSPEGGVTNPDLVSQIHAGKYTIYYYIDAKDYAPVKGSAVLDIDKAYLRVAVVDKDVIYGTRLDYKDEDFDTLYEEGYITVKAYKERAEQTELPFIEESVEGLNEFKLNMEGYTDHMTDIGEYKVTTSKLESDDYVIRYSSGKLTIDPKPVRFTWSHEDNYEFLYDGDEHGIEAYVFTDDLVGTDKREGQVEIVYEDNNKYPNTAVNVKRVKDETDTEKDWEVGTYTARVRRLTGERAHNYIINWKDKKKTFESHYKIIPVELTLTPNPVTTIYGDKAVDEGYTAKTLVNDEKQEDVILGTPEYKFTDMEKSAEYGPGGNVGEYKILITNIADPNTTKGLHAQNYNLTAADGTMTVVPREISFVWSTPNSFVYDAKDHEVKVVKVNNEYAPDDLVNKLTYTDNKKKDAGAYTAKAALPEGKAKNYTILDNTDSYDWKITKAALTVIAKDNTIYYGEAPAANGVIYKGLVGDETPSVLGGTLKYTFTYEKYGKPGVYDIIPGGLTSNNYTITYVKGKLYVLESDTTIVVKGKASGSKKLRLTWNYVNGAASYDIYFSKCNTKNKKFKPKYLTTVGAYTFSMTKGKLKKNTCYKFYVVAKDANNNVISRSQVSHAITGNVKGKYTNAKSLKVNQETVSVAKGGSVQLTVTQKKVKKNKKLLDGNHADLLRFVSTNNYVASVNDDGVIVGLNKGYCKVYVQTVNGIWKVVEVYVQ